MFKITQSMLNRKIKENRKNIGINSQCLTVKYYEETNSIRTSNIRSTRYKKYVVELIKSNLESNNLEYNADNLELVVLDVDCKYYTYKIESAEFDEEVAEYEKKVEAEEDERDLQEKKRKEKESERKKKNSQRKKESDESFYEEWADKFKALKNLIPSTENHFTGKGKEKKFKAEFRRKGNLVLTILKTLN